MYAVVFVWQYILPDAVSLNTVTVASPVNSSTTAEMLESMASKNLLRPQCWGYAISHARCQHYCTFRPWCYKQQSRGTPARFCCDKISIHRFWVSASRSKRYLRRVGARIGCTPVCVSQCLPCVTATAWLCNLREVVCSVIVLLVNRPISRFSSRSVSRDKQNIEYQPVPLIAKHCAYVGSAVTSQVNCVIRSGDTPDTMRVTVNVTGFVGTTVTMPVLPS